MRPRSPRAAVGVLLLALALGSALACAGWLREAPAPMPPPPPGPESAALLPLEAWQDTGLDCPAGPCLRWLRVEVAQPGELRVDVYAPTGPDVPDFDVALEDAGGTVLWGFAPTGHSPRQVRRIVGPGSYYLRLEGIGEVGGPLELEVFAVVEPVGAGLPGVARDARPLPEDLTARPGREAWLGADILGLEAQDGRPGVVVIDAGARDGLRLGQAGEVVDGGRTLAVFTLIEVDPSRCRGRLLEPLAGRVRPETFARVRIQLP